MNWLLTKVKQKLPVKAAAKAMLVNKISLASGIGAFFKYCLAAKKVPVKLGIFNDPITLETGSLGNMIKPAGV